MDYEKAPFLKANEVTCSNCKKTFNNILHKAALAYTCPHCKSYYVSEKGLGYKFIHKFKGDVIPHIPLYEQGKLMGVNYQVVGFAVRRQVGTTYDWREYTLFNPFSGFATLTEFDGHWIFAKVINDFPRIQTSYFPDLLAHNDKQYQKYNRYTSTVKYAIGEFSYDVFSDKHKMTCEWIAPPYMLIREKNEDEMIWSEAVGLSSREVKKAFGGHVMPEVNGVGALQLMKFSTHFSFMLVSTLIYFALLLIGSNWFGSNATEKKIFERDYTKSNVNSAGVIVTNSFEVTEGKTALQFDVFAPLNNDWFDLNFELINDVTGERFEGAKSLEFYQGYDSEGAWSEGKRGDYIIISSVPVGTYHLNLYPAWNSMSGLDVPFKIKIFQGVTLWANFTIFLLLGLIIPVVQYFRTQYFEQQRWMGSNYSPKLPVFNL
jgi:hypothetical protein